ncbi:protein tyrosine phosphatase family protein [Roseateles koreensis]|uniref:TIGR01244 family sulfur transferase n=1 Tax=Roseateles koreensis TaxID=2987526 RepID=A0ABT5KRN0_9BURK|nr:TIGR01244 family sulfur transferase [Roseateles koreensis]MDC8785095.1 TIGR01244 family sulfur transferase [Roseateles koreensis]
MSLPFQALTPDFSVAPQLLPEDIQQAQAAGFKSVINNRPDFEGGADQPTSALIAHAAETAGLVYRHLPVQGAYQSPEEIQAFRDLLDSLPKPILAFCRSGARAARLYAAATAL